MRMPLHDDLGNDLDTLARRDIAMRFIFAADDPGQGLLREQGGSVVTRLLATGRIGIQVIAGADHTFTMRWTHPILLDAITEAVEH